MSKIAVELSAGERIPVVDFPGLTGSNLALRKATAISMREAFEDFGFIYLQNHSVPQSVVDELFARSIAFFELPQATYARANAVVPAREGLAVVKEVAELQGKAFRFIDVEGSSRDYEKSVKEYRSLLKK